MAGEVGEREAELRHNRLQRRPTFEALFAVLDLNGNGGCDIVSHATDLAVVVQLERGEDRVGAGYDRALESRVWLEVPGVPRKTIGKLTIVRRASRRRTACHPRIVRDS
jgi:hypothetical protein